MKANLRIVVLAVAVAAACTDAFAQFGVNIGYMNSTTYSRVEGVEGSEKAGTNGFSVGIDHNIRLIGNLLSIQPGIYYQHLLRSEDIAEIAGLAANTTYMENFLAIPVHVKVGFNLLPKDVLRLYVFAGPTFEIGLSSSDKISVSGSLLGHDIAGEVSYNYYSGKIKTSSDELQSVVDSYFQSEDKGQLKRFDVMIGGGVGLQVVRFLDIKVGYDYGMVNRYAGDLAEHASANRGQFYVGVGIRL